MIAKLYHLQVPKQRCLYLAHAIYNASDLAGEPAVMLAQRLYACQHGPDNPAVLSIIHPEPLEELGRICREAGIHVEFLEE